MNTFSRAEMPSRILPRTHLRPLALAIALLFTPSALLAQPTGGQVVSGQANIGTPTNGLMIINQSSPKAILNWRDFSIGVGEATHFQQPVGGVALNRVTGGNPSQILGSLTATGQVFLVNPSGILFGKEAVLNVGGLAASTLDIADSDFLAGNYRFFNDGSARSITNQGQLGAYDGGYIALLAPEVRNEGLISARLGTVAMAAGNRISLDLAGDGLISLNIEESALNGRIENKQAIHADGGQVILSARAADSLTESVINNEGVIRASSVAERNGRIVLEDAHFISNSGRLDANGADGLDGGAIRMSADNVLMAGSVDVSGKKGGEIEIGATGNLIQTDASVMRAVGQAGAGGRINLQASHAEGTGQVFLSGESHVDGVTGGSVHVLGDKVTLADAAITATGAVHGGEILIGGGFRGAATGVANARQTGVSPTSLLDASATDIGAGGRVVVWSDGRTAFAGQALARGGVQGGDGGLIEVSGKESVFFDGMVNAGPTPGLGKNGTFLLDPKNIVISSAAQSSSGYFELSDPSPAAGDQHGTTVQAFGANQLFVLSPNDNNAAADAGAIYVYSTVTGAMLSMLTGDQANDRVGSGGMITLAHTGGSDYLIKSPLWHNSAGAVTWFDGAGTGYTGVVGAGNSLVGGTSGDQLGSGGITTINNGGIIDFIVRSPEWNGTFGAVTFGHGNTGITGLVADQNSLVGSHAGDRIGATLTQLASGNYVVRSTAWNGGAGAVTFLNRTTGVTGVVDASNSLIGSSNTDAVGSGGIQNIYDSESSQYQYLVLSPEWGGTFGAVTFGSGTAGISGAVSSSNSFVGDATGDRVGSGGIHSLGSGHTYLIESPSWHTSAGALTWIDGAGHSVGGGLFGGVVGASNSLVGAAGDNIASGGITQLDDGNSIVLSPNWNGGAGAVTYMNSATGIAGMVGAGNSLVGSASTDGVGSGGVESIYDNGTYNYLVFSPDWDDGKGAVTFGAGVGGVSGVVGSSNSYVGDQAGDHVGSGGITTLPNSGGYDYLISSPLWHGSAGAVTRFEGTGMGFGGVVGSDNSLVGSSAGDSVGSGGIRTISNNGVYDYFVLSPNWNGNRGAMTFAGGNTGVTGQIHSENSLIGSNAGDRIGSDGFRELADGNYLVFSPDWNGGAGAVTFMNRTTGIAGTVDSGNSLVGSSSTDSIGSGGMQEIYANGTYNYLVLSPLWNGNRGAVTFGSGVTGVSGEVGPGNSYVGDTAGDSVGSGGIATLSNNGGYAYLIKSPLWHASTGAVTWFDGSTGFGSVNFNGVVSSSNSLVGGNAGDNIGSGGITTVSNNGVYDYVVLSPNWDGTKGAVTLGNGATGISGVVASGNSFVGDQAGDRVGSGGITPLLNSGGNDYLIYSPLWHGSAGAVTWFDGAGAGFGGVIGAGNSLAGSNANDGLGSGGITTILNNGVFDYVILSPNWNGLRGAMTYHDGASGIVGTINSTNSLIGDQAGDRIGSSGLLALSASGNYVVRSPNWHGGTGAVTFMDRTTGIFGVASSANSLVGSASTDNVGAGGVTSINDNGNFNFLVYSPNWNGTRGAVTFGSGSTGISGLVGAGNSFVGDQAGDKVGSGSVTTLFNTGGRDYLLKSPLWHGSAGAVTWFDGAGSGFGGVVSSANSLVGSHANDQIGLGGISTFNVSGTYNYLVFSPNWNGNFGAVTFGNGAVGVKGDVSSANSLVGSHAGDFVGSDNLTLLSSGNYLIGSPNWNGGLGALTFITTASGAAGVVSSSNSIVGAQAGDLATWHSSALPDGHYLLNLATWAGNAGRLLVMTDTSGGGVTNSGWNYVNNPGGDITITPAQISAIANNGTQVLLQANNDITLVDDLVIDNVAGVGGDLVLRAGRSIFLNHNITSDGNIRLYANDTAANGVQAAYRDSGLAEITMASGTKVETTGNVLMHMLDGLSAGSAGGITLATIKAAGIDFLGDVLLTNNGKLGGSGTITGDLTVINGTLAPGQSPGSMSITGDLTLGEGSLLSIEYGGANLGEYDSISVGGTAVLGGALEVLSYNGFVPPEGFSVPFFSAGTTSGAFSSVTGELAGSVPIPDGGSTELVSDSIQSTLQAEINPDEESLDLRTDLSPVAALDRLVDVMFSQASESNVVGTTQQTQSASVQLAARRESRVQAFAPAISELRANPRAADIKECSGGGESSGACLATRKVKDVDKLIADAPADTRKRVAVLIGNDAYTGDIPALSTPISDVNAIAANLKEKHGFEVTVLRNAGKADIIREMNRLATDTVVADSVVVMYAGHGYQDEGKQGMGYWIPVDAKSNSAAGWVSNQDISKLLFAIPARQVMLVSDSCFSGSLTREQRVKAVKGLKREEVLKQRSVLVLSSGGEEPVTDQGHEGHSIFAWNLLKVLNTADAGLTGFELYRQVHEGVIKEFPQQPQYGASIFAGHKGDGDYFLDRLN